MRYDLRDRRCLRLILHPHTPKPMIRKNHQFGYHVTSFIEKNTKIVTGRQIAMRDLHILHKIKRMKKYTFVLKRTVSVHSFSFITQGMAAPLWVELLHIILFKLNNLKESFYIDKFILMGWRGSYLDIEFFWFFNVLKSITIFLSNGYVGQKLDQVYL